MKKIISLCLTAMLFVMNLLCMPVTAENPKVENMYCFSELSKNAFENPEYIQGVICTNFSAEDMMGVEADDTVVLSLKVKAEEKCTRADVAIVMADGEKVAMTYFVPVQWVSINMPVVGPVDSVGIDVAEGTVLLGGITVTDYNGTKLSDPSIRGGMWMVDDFDTYVLDETDAFGTDSIDIVKNGDYTYTIGSNGMLTVTDVSDRNNPLVTATLKLGVGLRQIAMCKSGTDVMISARQNGAFIVDVSDSKAPKVRSEYDTVEFATGMHICGDFAFISCRQFGVEVVDISDLDNPRHLSIVRCGEAQSCEVVDGILYAGLWGECAVDMYDVSNPLSPVKLGRAKLNGKGDGMKVATISGRTYLYAATGQHTVSVPVDTPLTDLRYGQGNGMDIFDVTDPANPQWLSTSKIDGRYYYTANDYWETDVMTDGERIYVALANTYNGVYIYDVTDPEAPVRLANVNIRIATDSDNYPGVYKHTSREIVFPYDQNEYHQSPVGAVVCEDGAMYIAGVFTGMHVFLNDDILLRGMDSADGNHIKAEGHFYEFDAAKYGLDNFYSYRSFGQTYAVAVWGDYIYLANGCEGIVVLDEELNKVGNIATGGFAMDIVIEDGMAYVAQGTDGLVVYSVSGAKLTEINRFRIASGTARQVRLSPKARFAAVHADSSAIEFIRLSDGFRVSKYLTNTQGYFRNLSQSLIDGRYIGFYGNNGRTYWFDFGTEDDFDAPKVVENSHTADDNIYFDISAIHMQSGYENLNGKAFGFVSAGYYVLYDVANPGVASMSNMKKYKTNVSVMGKPVVYGNKLVMGDRVNGNIYIGDVSNPEAIQITKSIAVSGNPEMAVITDDYMLLPLGHQGLFKFSLPKPDGAGLFGKPDDEISMPDTKSNGAKHNTIFSFDEDYGCDGKKYAVVDLNFAPVTKWASVTCGPDAGLATITKSFADGSIKLNQWNNVRIVAAQKTAEEIKSDGYYQPMRMYINGKEIIPTLNGNIKEDENGDGYRYKLNSGDNLVTGDTASGKYYGRGIRISLIAPSAGSATAYITDVKKYSTDSIGVPVMPEVSGIDGLYRLDASSKRISPDKAVTVGDIKSDADVRVYSDSSMETRIKDSKAILTEGNVIVAADDLNKRYTYYTFGTKNILYDFTEGNIVQTVSGGTKSLFTDGIGGKTDPVLKITRDSASVSGKKETYFDVVYDGDRSDGSYSSSVLTADFMSKDTAKYVVLECDIYPTASTDRFSIAGHQSARLLSNSNYIEYLVKNQWNKIALVVSNNSDSTNPTPGDTMYNSAGSLPSNIHSYRLYINNRLIESGKMKRFGYWWYDTRERRECFFRIAVAMNNSPETELYMDNIRLYDANVADCTEYADIDGEITGNGARFSTRITNGILLVAAYNDAGDLIGKPVYKRLGNGVSSVEIYEDDAAVYIGYIWSDLKNLTPLCEKLTVFSK